MVIPQLFLPFGANIYYLLSRMASGGGPGDKPKTNWPARDYRPEYGGNGGARPKAKVQPKSRAKPVSQPRPVKLGGPDCTLCTGVCCGVARALVEEAFGLGVMKLSPKVSKGNLYGDGT